MAQTLINYLRERNMPHLMCPGCGHGTILKCSLAAIEKLGLDKDKVCVVSGIGCSSRMTTYVDFDTLHTTHGRAIPFATGIKLHRPGMNVIVMTGDGDAAAIGGNHLIHAARRNIDLSVLCFNNSTYGMTSGQVSPTTPLGRFATTAPYGNIDRPFDLCALAAGAGATYVARGDCFNVKQLEKLVTSAIAHHGFSFVDIISQCPTYYGRKNRIGDAYDMLVWQKESRISDSDLTTPTPEGKYKVGEFVNVEGPDLCDRVRELIERVQSQAEEEEGVEEEIAHLAPTIGRYEVRLGGSGGQGIVLAGMILGEAASLYGDKHAIQTQVYGPEARGGASKSEVVIADGDVDYPKVISPDVLVAMNQPSFDRFAPEVKDEGTVVANSSFAFDLHLAKSRVAAIPISEISQAVTGRAVSSNIVALGVFSGLTHVVPRDALARAVKHRVPPRTIEANLLALDAGFRAGELARVQCEKDGWPTTDYTCKIALSDVVDDSGTVINR
jgi:2-oxoglutarate ferredoxin oxidoreductase subunit beta